jgi:hypothetical protein
MTANAEARHAEARDNVWLGEVAALEESLTHLRRHRAEAESQRPHSIVRSSSSVKGPVELRLECAPARHRFTPVR